MKLYEIAAELENLLTTAEVEAEANGGEIRDGLAERIEALEMAKDDKISNICRLFKNLSAEADAIKAEEKRLAERRKSAENRADSLKRYLASFASGYAFADQFSKLSWRKSTATVVDNPSEVPDEYTVTEIKPYLPEIKKAIEAGKTVPGAHLENRVSPQIK